MTEQDLRKLTAEIEANVLAKLTAKKREESTWRKVKSDLRKKLDGMFDAWESHKFMDATAAIGRLTLNKNSVERFTDTDVRTVESLMDELLAVCAKYRKEG